MTADGVRLSYCDLGPETVDEWLQTVFGDGQLVNRFLLGKYGDAPTTCTAAWRPSARRRSSTAS